MSIVWINHSTRMINWIKLILKRIKTLMRKIEMIEMIAMIEMQMQIELIESIEINSIEMLTR